MKQSLTLISVAILFGLAGFSGYHAFPRAESSQTPPQELLANHETIDFGNVGQGETVQVEFHLTNTSKGGITIGSVVTGCHCTEPRVVKSRLAAGESTSLNVKYTTGAGRGRVGQTVGLYYLVGGEKTTRVMQLGIGGNIEPDFKASETSFDFDATRGESRVLTLSPGRRVTLDVKEAYCTHDAFTATLEHSRTNPDAWEVTVAFLPDKWTLSKGEAYLLVITDSPNQPKFQVSLQVNAVAPKSVLRNVVVIPESTSQFNLNGGRR